MNFDDIISQRRSVRSYLDREIPYQWVHKILEYGHAAPSAGNIQPWEFIVIRDEENKRAIVDTTFIGNNEVDGKPQNWLLSAPVFIVVCANRDKVMKRYGETSLNSLVYLDASACIENMLLGAVYLGLASCYVSGFRKKELSEVLGLPKSHEPIGLLPIGYSTEVCLKRPKIDINEITHFEKFINKQEEKAVL